MSDVLNVLDCGCVIMRDGRRVVCPTCEGGAPLRDADCWCIDQLNVICDKHSAKTDARDKIPLVRTADGVDAREFVRQARLVASDATDRAYAMTDEEHPSAIADSALMARVAFYLDRLLDGVVLGDER